MTTTTPEVIASVLVPAADVLFTVGERQALAVLTRAWAMPYKTFAPAEDTLVDPGPSPP